jgi:hypothetical protein
MEVESLPITGNRINARSARTRLMRERIILALEKYHPKMRPNPKTKYGNAATGCWHQSGSPCGRRKPTAAKNMRPPGRRKARIVFSRPCCIWAIYMGDWKAGVKLASFIPVVTRIGATERLDGRLVIHWIPSDFLQESCALLGVRDKSVWFHPWIRSFLNGHKFRNRSEEGCYEEMILEVPPDIRRRPFAGSMETATLPSSICMSKSPTNCQRQPRNNGRSMDLLFSWASTSA